MARWLARTMIRRHVEPRGTCTHAASSPCRFACFRSTRRRPFRALRACELMLTAPLSVHFVRARSRLFVRQPVEPCHEVSRLVKRGLAYGDRSRPSALCAPLLHRLRADSTQQSDLLLREQRPGAERTGVGVFSDRHGSPPPRVGALLFPGALDHDAIRLGNVLASEANPPETSGSWVTEAHLTASVTSATFSLTFEDQIRSKFVQKWEGWSRTSGFRIPESTR